MSETMVAETGALDTPSTFYPPVPMPLDDLARLVNDAHKAARVAARDMVFYAVEIGNLLLEAKKRLPHGQFLPWLKANCRMSRIQANRYMRAAKCIPGGTFDADTIIESSIKGLIGEETAQAHKKATVAKAASGFDRDDAERALKLHASATRGSNENEMEMAAAKLEGMAESFGMSVEKLLAEATTKAPEFYMSPNEVAFGREVIAEEKEYIEFVMKDAYQRIYVEAETISRDDCLSVAQGLYEVLLRMGEINVEVIKLRAEVEALKRAFGK